MDVALWSFLLMFLALFVVGLAKRIAKRAARMKLGFRNGVLWMINSLLFLGLAYVTKKFIGPSAIAHLKDLPERLFCWAAYFLLFWPSIVLAFICLLCAALCDLEIKLKSLARRIGGGL